MIEFLKFIFTGPMLIYTIPLCLVVLYWGVMVLGVVDIDFLDGGADAALDGALDGAADAALDGAADAALDGAADAALDGAADAAADAALDGAADAGTDSVLDAVGHAAHGMDHAHAAVTGVGTEGGGIFGFLNFGSAPATVIISLLIFTMWFFACIGHWYLGRLLGDVLSLFGVAAVVLPVSIVTSIFLTHFTTIPFRGLMKNPTRHSGDFLIGQKCVIRTGRVTETFGQAEVHIKGAPLVISVVCERGKDYGFKKGDEAFIIYYEKAKNTYVISPVM